MDLYRERPGELDGQQFSAALMAADAAALALLRIKADPLPFAADLAEMPPYQSTVHRPPEWCRSSSEPRPRTRS